LKASSQEEFDRKIERNPLVRQGVF
jgi:hypothetical protein